MFLKYKKGIKIAAGERFRIASGYRPRNDGAKLPEALRKREAFVFLSI